MSSEQPYDPFADDQLSFQERWKKHHKLMDTDPEYSKRVLDREAQEERERRAKVEVLLREQDARIAAERRESAIKSLPERLRSVATAPEETKALSETKEFLNSASTILVLAGGVGTGKTIAAAWAIVESRGGKYVKAIELSQHGLYGEENQGFWDDLRATPLLVIDDLGTEPRDEKGFAAANFDALMDHRYDHCRKTILTTNLTDETFKQVYCTGFGVRLLDRIREVGHFVRVPGQSMRRRPGASDA